MATIVKRDWYGGINQLPDRAKINFAAEYALMVNGRVRDNSVTPVNGPVDITAGLPTEAAVQGLYAFGEYLFVFAGGRAYYRNYSNATPGWEAIPSLQLSETAQIEAVEIPESYTNFIRYGTDDDDREAPVVFRGTKNSSPSSIFVTDGVNQPWIILRNFSARVTKTYAEWTIDVPEYVPIMRHPYWSPDGILYGIIADNSGIFNTIVRSVSGSPLNFCIIVDRAGNKVGTEAEGGAPALSYRVDYSENTYIGPINTASGSYLVTTARNTYLVTPDYTRLRAGEPTFTKQYLFDIGALNQNCVVGVNGDTTVVHSRGIRSFNGVAQLKFEGKFAPFNLRINKLMENIIQTAAAAGQFENYAVYALQTVHGYGLLWYDMLLERWVSLDLYSNQSPVTQFATVSAGAVDKMFFRTQDGRIFELFQGPVEKCTVFLADLLPMDNNGSSDDSGLHSVESVYLVFSDGNTSGYAAVGYYIDGAYIGSVTSDLVRQGVAESAVVTPVTSDLVITAASTRPLTFSLASLAAVGCRARLGITWNTAARLVSATVDTQNQKPRQKATYDQEFIPATKIILVGSDANLTDESSALNLRIKKEKPALVIGLGSHTFNGTSTDVAQRLSYHWNDLHNIGKFYAAPGPGEMDTSVGEPFFQFVRQTPSRYSILQVGDIKFFLLCAGINSAGTQVEPDNLDGPTLVDSTQCEWLKYELRNSTAAYNFLVLGTPPRSSVPGVESADWNAFPFATYGVDAVFAGLGNYERLEDAARIVFVNSGTGGNPLVPFGPPRSDSAVRISQLGYVRLTITPLSALVEFVLTDGTVADRRLL